MNNENGQINFTLGLDDTEYNQQLDADIQKQERLGTEAEKTGKRVDSAFHKEAMSARELNDVIDTQTKVVAGLRQEYEKAKDAANKAFDGNSSDYSELIGQQERLRQEYDDEREALIRLQKQRESMSTGGDVEESIRMQLRNTTQELAAVTLQYRAMSAEEQASAEGQSMRLHMEELAKKAGTLKDAMDDANREVRGFASDTGNFDAIAGGINVLTSSVGAAEGAMTMLGMSQEDLMEIQTKLQASLAISNALSVIQNNLQKESALMLGVRKVQESAAATAIAIRTAAEGKGIIVTKAATVSQVAFNLVAKANPYVLLAMALLSVVGAFIAFAKGSNEATEAEKRQQEQTKKLREEQQRMLETIGRATGNLESKYRSLQIQWKNLKTEADKTKWIKDNADAFNELGLKVNGVADAETVLVKMAPQVIAALKAVAEAEAYNELYKEAVINRAKKWEHRTKSRATGDFYTRVGDDDKKSRYITTEWADAGLKEGVDFKYHRGGDMGRGKYWLEQSGIDKVNAYRMKKAQELNATLKKGYDDEVDQYGDMWEKAVDKAQAAKAKIPSAYLSGGGALNSSNSGGTGSKGDKPDNTPRNTPKEDAARQLEAYYDALEEISKRREDAMAKDKETQEERELAQLVLNHKRQLEEIDAGEKELAKKKKDAGKGALSDDEIKMFQDRRDAENSIYARTLQEREDAKRKKESELAAKEKADMEAYLIQYGDYQQRITAIHAKYETERQNAKTEGERLSLSQQESEEIDAVNVKFGRATQAMADLFADASKKSVSEIQKIITKYETLIKFMEGQKSGNATITTDDLKGLGFSEKDIDKVNKGEISIKELTDAIKQLTGELGDRSPWQAFQKNMDEAIKNLKSGELSVSISGIGDAIQQFAPKLQELGDKLGDAFGLDTAGLDTAFGMLGELGNMASSVGQIMSGDLVGGIMGGISAISGLASCIGKLIDAKHEKRIKKLQENIDALEQSYDDLERAVSHSYSFVKQNNIKLEIASKQQQIALIKQQIQEERDKKKTDNDRIKEWQDKIHDLQQNIIDLKESAVDAIFGEDMNSAIDNFASAYADAWAQGEDKAKSAKDVVKNMMKQMVIESIKSAVQASGAMERIRQKLQTFLADNVLSQWEQDYVVNMAESLQKQLDNQFGWADSLLGGEGNGSSQESSSRGFETMTQDQADELSGRFTGIQIETAGISKKIDMLTEGNAQMRAHTAEMAQNTAMMVELQGVAVSHLEQIAKNTAPLSEMNDRLEKIEKNTRKL